MVETKLEEDVLGRVRDGETQGRVERLARMLAGDAAGAPQIVEDVNDQSFERVIRETFAMGADPSPRPRPTSCRAFCALTPRAATPTP